MVSQFVKKILPLLMLVPLVAQADPVERLKAFYQSTPAMKAVFKQTVLDRKGQTVQEVMGTMQLLRPGKFRWDYQKPYVQIIVGDGKKIWLFDPELSQVTVRSLEKMLGSSPAALLAGSKEVEKAFDLKDAGRQDELEWVEATPKQKDGSFESVLLGFKGDQLAEMELHDSFGQTTIIEFAKIERNPKLNPNTFVFVPPRGVDVVGE
ncbi:outer membrane lipoprotein carrier protein [Novimethylophilus kurashikiensis]|uniref:Outer-membrane lipoprotein carrier protein n=2 Tax=Novimethylophilus kurashikiensis TaxID=1825523 RepID=A0A2R5F4F5_9PROT|nr:outer membrane lipoprotein chaperone LolA [Novimethylophilus kurashikiensis]GBG12628.1 outer membrane lipoprotein carrier protein [Novimethylophilus kurashikiensis]